MSSDANDEFLLRGLISGWASHNLHIEVIELDSSAIARLVLGCLRPAPDASAQATKECAVMVRNKNQRHDHGSTILKLNIDTSEHLHGVLAHKEVAQEENAEEAGRRVEDRGKVSLPEVPPGVGRVGAAAGRRLGAVGSGRRLLDGVFASFHVPPAGWVSKE